MLSQKASIKNRDGEIGQPTAQRNMLNILKMMISTGKKFTAYHTRLCKVQYKLLHRYLATSDFFKQNWYFFITTMFSVRWGRWIPWTPFCLFPDYSEILGRNGVAIGGGGRGVVISHLSAKDILFGKMVYKDNLFINHILLVGKQYIYYRRYTNTNPCLQVFLARLGNVYQY